MFPFQIPIFEKGYEKDPAIVAKEAIQEASRNGSDVVLVDTAGRMQVIIAVIVIVKCLVILWAYGVPRDSNDLLSQFTVFAVSYDELWFIL